MGRPRYTEAVVLLASASRTASTNTSDQTNLDARGVMLVIDVTIEGAPTLAMKIQGKDPLSGNYFDLVTFGTLYTAASEAPTRTKACVLYPGVLTADHVGVAAGTDGAIAKSGVLPRHWRAVVTHGDATATTYSLTSQTLP